MATSSKSSRKPKVAVKNPRKILTIAEQKAKIEAAKQKIETAKKKITALESKLAVNDMKEFIASLKVDNLGSLFLTVEAERPGANRIHVLETLAEIGGLKVTITEKVKVARKPKTVASC